MSIIEMKWSREADVVIVGYGGAGSCAAIEAHDAGAEVVILEKAKTVGGSTLISGGFVYMGGMTAAQKARGVEDTPDEMFKFLEAYSEELSDIDKLRTCADQSVDLYEFLTKLGVAFPPEFLMIGGSEEEPKYTAIARPAPRSHRVKEKNGAGLMRFLRKAVKERCIEEKLETPAKRLITDLATREVLGVTAESKGEEVNFEARKAVILASGGFGHNKDMMRNYVTEHAKLPFLGPPSLTGDGVRMAQALGAAVQNMGWLEPYNASVLLPHGNYSILSIQVARGFPMILTDSKGKRIVNEYLAYSDVGRVIEKQESGTAYCIFDEKVKRELNAETLNWFMQPWLSKDLNKEIALGIIKTAPTIKELAFKLGIAPDELEHTIIAFNNNVKRGEDPEFGRKMYLVPVDQPPFYGLRTTSTFPACAGGLRTNLNAQVIDVFGEVIPRLYAAGETVGGQVGAHYALGMYLMFTFTFGRIAGKNAAGETSRN